MLSLSRFLTKRADPYRDDSFSAKMRRRRFLFFKSLIASLPRPLSILDIGGTQSYWEAVGFNSEPDIQIVLFNRNKVEGTYPNFTCIVGDGTNLRQFKAKEFDVVFSNSVIQYIGDQRHQMAQEVRRVGKRYFFQTPNRFFPIEPHFLFPFFQFLPLPFKVFLIRHFNLGWRPKTPDREKAIEIVNSIRLLTETELKETFPEARIYRETFFGLTKSFTVYEGWDGR